MYDSYPKDFKGFHPEDEKKRKRIIHEIREGYRSPGDLDQHDKAVSARMAGKGSHDPIYKDSHKNIDGKK